MSAYENSQLLLDYLYSRGGFCSLREIKEEFGWSRPTFFRCLKRAREEGNEIIADSKMGYRLERPDIKQNWKGYSDSELELLAFYSSAIERMPELEGQESEEQKQLFQRLRMAGIPADKWRDRVFHAVPQNRNIKPTVFREVNKALLQQKVLIFEYRKSDGSISRRTVHPQLLLKYRNGWVLGAYEPKSVVPGERIETGLRQFSLDMIRHPRQSLKGRWVEIPVDTLKEQFRSGYGLFSGKSDSTAVVRFVKSAAIYALREKWHPLQTTRKKSDGSVVLTIPYNSRHPQDLIGDILRWGDEAEPIEPDSLRDEWKKKIGRLARKLK